MMKKKVIPIKEKHGIDFMESQQLWNDPDILEVKTKSEIESRFIVIGKINENIGLL